jgi:hypothetical protein
MIAGTLPTMLPVTVTRTTRVLLAALALAALTLVIALAGSAGAATKHGITPLSPKAGATVPAGRSPIFRMRKVGSGQLWVHVCKSAKRDKSGVICHGASIGQAHKAHGAWEYKPQFFDFPAFWLNRPGTYYWQAYRIACDASISDCKQESPVVKFKVG